jgi:hypothetical protein
MNRLSCMCGLVGMRWLLVSIDLEQELRRALSMPPAASAFTWMFTWFLRQFVDVGHRTKPQCLNCLTTWPCTFWQALRNAQVMVESQYPPSTSPTHPDASMSQLHLAHARSSYPLPCPKTTPALIFQSPQNLTGCVAMPTTPVCSRVFLWLAAKQMWASQRVLPQSSNRSWTMQTWA